jgi:hypothetical protein
MLHAKELFSSPVASHSSTAGTLVKACLVLSFLYSTIKKVHSPGITKLFTNVYANV